jgi:hypothetical protein
LLCLWALYSLSSMSLSSLRETPYILFQNTKQLTVDDSCWDNTNHWSCLQEAQSLKRSGVVFLIFLFPWLQESQWNL